MEVELIKITLLTDEFLHDFKILFAEPKPIEAILIKQSLPFNIFESC